MHSNLSVKMDQTHSSTASLSTADPGTRGLTPGKIIRAFKPSETSLINSMLGVVTQWRSPPWWTRASR